MIESFFKTQRANVNQAIGSVILLDGPGWRYPLTISVESLSSLLNVIVNDISDKIDRDSITVDPSTLKIRVNNEFVDVARSVSCVDFIDQDVSIHRPPNTYPVVTRMHLATDQNFLYIWSGDKWKRVALSDF